MGVIWKTLLLLIGDICFLLGYLDYTLYLLSNDISNPLKLIKVLADTELRYIQVLNLFLNEHVETRSSLICIYSGVTCICVCR